MIENGVTSLKQMVDHEDANEWPGLISNDDILETDFIRNIYPDSKY